MIPLVSAFKVRPGSKCTTLQSQSRKVVFFGGNSDKPTPEEIANTDDDSLFEILYKAASLIGKIRVLQILRPKAPYADVRETAERDHQKS